MVNRRSFLSLAGPSLFLLGCQNKMKSGSFREPTPEDVKPEKPTAAAENNERQENQGTTSQTGAENEENKSAPLDSKLGSNSALLAGLKVTFDVGHAFRGQDLSAESGEINEHKQVRLQAENLKNILTKNGATVKVKIYETADISQLDDRGREANGSHIFVSLHHNAFSDTSVQGTETLIDSRRGQKNVDQKLAGFIQKRMVETLWKNVDKKAKKAMDRGVKDQKLAVMINTPKSVEACCTTEPYFITGTGARQSYEKWSKESAEAIASGILDWYLSRNSGNLNLTEGPPLYPISPSDPIDADVYADH